MKKSFYLFLAAALCVGVLSACDPKEDPAKELKLTASATTIVADGTDAVTFTVTYGGEAVTDATIAGAEGYSFTTTEAAEYKFTATYDGQTSNEVTVTATAANTEAFVLTADKYEVSLASGEVVTFSATMNGEEVTSFQVCNPAGVCLMEPVYKPNDVGEFNFYGTDMETNMKSEEITITVLP